MRDRLVALINEAKDEYPTIPSVNCCKPTFAYYLADRLLANGVIVPPCKVGQTVWYVDKGAERVKPIKVISYEICNNGEEEFGCWGGDFTPTRFHVENIGKTVFLTREEAEQALLKP